MALNITLRRHLFRALIGSRGLTNINSVESSPQTSLVISESAVQRLKEITGDRGWLRLAVQGGGCSGFQYNFELEEEGGELGEDDVLVEKDGGRVVVDTTSFCVSEFCFIYKTKLVSMNGFSF